MDKIVSPNQGAFVKGRWIADNTVVAQEIIHKREEEQGGLHGIKIARIAPAVSHLMYADDLLIMCRADPKEASIIKDKLNGLVRRFYWENKPNDNGYLALKAWKDIGFRRFKDMNLAILAKLGWKLASGEECLWKRMMKAKYLRNETFFSYTPKKDASWVWKGIVKSRYILRKWVCFHIEDSTAIDLWKDMWVLNLPNKCPIAREETAIPYWRRVYELWDFSNLNWKADVVRQLFDDDSAEAILKLEWPEVSCSNKLIWLESKEGKFSVKSYYELLVKNSSSEE
ncbi:hypothetical protein FEM48_Zijuj02G0126500 [Ziziphus jujuba var. spinosa]|uniref:Uncharacterized protein n=1 Tax=Ziziphus jujuba var. spinosa TaxID=714518 RepID=A0A978VVS6_ZIZJJ|nr:hypothetical protein FEM48_Zijuj02G0126500 [Ziziphus jujuba var. spinosa]